jgi:hypothetical protein
VTTTALTTPDKGGDDGVHRAGEVGDDRGVHVGGEAGDDKRT